jgi:hypothetical protein
MEMPLDQQLASLERSEYTPMTISPASTRFRGAAIVLGAFGVLLVVCLVVVGPLTLAFPRTCTQCHVPATAYAAWGASTHSAVRCEQCHVDRGVLGGLGNSVALAADVRSLALHKSGGSVRVPDEACTSCHKNLGQEQPIVVRGLRMSHAGLAEAGYGCTECHADVAHPLSAGRAAGVRMSTCAQCHNNVKQSGECTICHVTKGTKAEGQRSDPEWSIIHGPLWRQTHGMGDLTTCTVCHSKDDCKKCHGVDLPHDDNFFATHGKQALDSASTCPSCHSQALCDGCHGLRPSDYLKIHPLTASGVSDPRCTKCHVSSNCQECHIKHIHPGGAKP